MNQFFTRNVHVSKKKKKKNISLLIQANCEWKLKLSQLISDLRSLLTLGKQGKITLLSLCMSVSAPTCHLIRSQFFLVIFYQKFKLKLYAFWHWTNVERQKECETIHDDGTSLRTFSPNEASKQQQKKKTWTAHDNVEIINDDI